MSTSLFCLTGMGEYNPCSLTETDWFPSMKPRLGRRIADRFQGAAHTGEGITNGNQPLFYAAWLILGSGLI